MKNLQTDWQNSKWKNKRKSLKEVSLRLFYGVFCKEKSKVINLALKVSHPGLEPGTPGLKVQCSTD